MYSRCSLSTLTSRPTMLIKASIISQLLAVLVFAKVRIDGMNLDNKTVTDTVSTTEKKQEIEAKTVEEVAKEMKTMKRAAEDVQPHSHQTQLKFHLAYAEVTCFTEDFHVETISNYTFQYQVFNEGTANVWLQDRNSGRYLHHDPKGQRNAVTFLVAQGVSIIFCFNNNANIYTKTVYMSIRPTINAINEWRVRPGPFGLSETLCESMKTRLTIVRIQQQRYRNDAEDGRQFASSLNTRVQLLSSVNMAAILLTLIAQTLALKRLFNKHRYV